MKNLRYLLIGILLGIVMTKSEVISWYRIQEMFRFQDFHMYGVIGSAVVLGAVLLFLIKKSNLKSLDGDIITIKPKEKGYARTLIGGILFGLGWAFTGACPGPIYVLIGNGFLVFIVVLLSALIGALAYGTVRDKLPH